MSVQSIIEIEVIDVLF